MPNTVGKLGYLVDAATSQDASDFILEEMGKWPTGTTATVQAVTI